MTHVNTKYWGFQNADGTAEIELAIDERGNGVINDNARRAFTRGQCHALAHEISRLTGWEIVAIGRSYDPIQHLMVKAPSGKLLDIEGVHEIEPFGMVTATGIQLWQIELLDPQYFSNYLEPDLEAAYPFALSVLEQADWSLLIGKQQTLREAIGELVGFGYGRVDSKATRVIKPQCKLPSMGQ